MKPLRGVCCVVAVPALSALLAGGLQGLEFETRAISRTDPSLPNVTAAFDSVLGIQGYAVTDDGGTAVFSGWSPNLLEGFTFEISDVLLYDVASGSVAAVSHRHDDPTIGGNGQSQYSAISGDGSTVVFSSIATNLVAGYSGSASQLYAASVAPDEIELVSSAWNDPLAGANGSCWPIAISETGRYVYFTTSATNLLEGYSGQGEQIYLADLLTGSITLVSHAWNSTTAGASGSLWSSSVSVDSEGRFLAFTFQSADLVPGNSGTHFQVYLFDRTSGAVSLVSHAAGSPGQVANETSGEVALSASGSHLAFRSSATDLVAGSQVSGFQVYVVELSTGEMTLASSALNAPSNGGNADSTLPSLSGDGRYLSFTTLASDLVDGVVPGTFAQVVLFDRANGDRLLASHTPLGPTSASIGGSIRSTVARDGARVIFDSEAIDLVFPPLPNWIDFQVYSFEVASGQVRLLTRTHGDPSLGGSAQTLHHSISADGSRVLFYSDAEDFVEGDWNVANDAFMSEPLSGDLEAFSRRDPDLPFSRTANGMSFYTAHGLTSEDGRFSLFWSYAHNLLPGLTFDPFANQRLFLYDAEFDLVTWVGSDLIGLYIPDRPLVARAGEAPVGLETQDYHQVSSDASAVLVSGISEIGQPMQAYVHLRREGVERLISHRYDEEGTPGDAGSVAYSVSSSGGHVVVVSEATNLVAGYSGEGSQLYLYDITARSSQLVTHRHGAPASGSDGNHELLGLSFDGRWIAFRSDADDLVPSTGGTYIQAYLFDAADGSIRLASHVPGSPGVASAFGLTHNGASMSQDGRYLAFSSQSADLIGLSGGFDHSQVVVWDRLTSTHRLASRSAAGPQIPSNHAALAPRISRDGQYVAFNSEATDLAAGYVGVGLQLYRFGLASGTNLLVSHSIAGPAHGSQVGVWSAPSISADGSRLAVFSASEDLSANSPTSGAHVYVYDAATDEFTVLTGPPDGRFVPLPGTNVRPEISADGRAVVFHYDQDYLVDRDWNLLSDSFDVFLVRENPVGLIFRDGFASGDVSRWSGSSTSR